MSEPTKASRSRVDGSNHEIELAKLQLARDQFEYEKGRSGRLTTPQIALIGSLLSVASGIVGAAVTGWFSKQSEEVKLQAGVGIEEIKGGTSINLEKLKFETGLVIQAIKTDDQAKAVKTLKFFANAGLIPTFEKRVLALAEADNGVGVPALDEPSAIHSPTPGRFGYMVIAAIAWNRLSPTQQASAARLLKLNPMYPTWVDGVAEPDRDKVAFIRAAVWADDIKRAADYISDGPDNGNRPPPEPVASRNIGYADHFRHKYWHFIEMPFSPDGTPLIQPQKPNAQTQIAAFRVALSDPNASDEVKSYGMVWLLHLVGDVHQPLQVTSRFTRTQAKGDAGGNLVKIACSNVCSQRVLHSLWDDLIDGGDSPQEAAAVAVALPEPDPQLANDADENAWIHESFEAAKRFVYVPPIGVGAGPFSITDTYKMKAQTVAKERAALAGVRLANLLKSALK